MKKSIYLLLLMVVSFSACNKSSENNSSSSSLNSFENVIKGKWFLKSKSDSAYANNKLTLTSVFSKFQGTPYIELNSTKSNTSALGGAKAKDAKDAGTNLGNIDFGAPIPITTNSFWYYDETYKFIVFGGFILVPVKATNSELELKSSYGDKSQISYNFTWKFTR